MGDADDATEHDATEHDATGRDAADEATSTPGDEVMDLLAEHVPLALLADLAAPSDEVSTEILQSEGLPDDAWWETSDDAGTEPTTGGAEPSGGPVDQDPATA